MTDLSKNHLPKTTSHTLVIGWLYPELMNVYGDRGNIIVLEKRAQWRGIKTKVLELNPEFDRKLLNECDLLLMGGAQDRQQTIVNKDLKRIKKTLSEKIENGTPGLYVCGGFQFLGKYYKEADGKTVDGLGIFDLYTENPGENIKRLIGNMAIEPLIEGLNQTIVGFENHGGRTYLGDKVKPLGKVLKGFGNSEDGFEGAVYKNSIGTYMHGPILPKNPQLADFLIAKALGTQALDPLDDTIEEYAHKAIANRLQLPLQ
jgi:CobQ-like glutamine amidotransferase family enzyme